MRMDAGTKTSPIYLVVDNTNTTGITRTANGGHIHSENQWDIVQWNSGTGTGNYVYPFGVGGNPSDYIPFSFNKTTAVSSNISTSTWATNPQNMPHPDTSNLPAVNIMDCPNMYSTGDSVTAVIDRFWDIRSPAAVTADVTFSYLGSENTTANPNGTFKAEHWNGTTWDAPVGPGDAGVTSGVGTVGPVTGQTTFSPWTLVGIPTPLTIASATTSICSGTAATFTASGAVTYTWSANAGAATTSTISVSPGSSDTYTVTGTHSGGCTASETVAISVLPSPTVTIASTGTAVCAGQTATLTANGATSYTWSTTETTSTISVSPANTTIYTVTGDNAGCTNTQQVTVTVNALPTLASVGNQTVCSGNPVSAINYSAGGANVNWTNTNGNVGISTSGSGDINGYTAPNVITQETGVITATPIDNGTGCSGTSQSYIVIINPTPMATGGVVDSALCGVANGGISGINVTGGTPAYTYQWYNNGVLMPGETNPTLGNAGMGNYNVIITDVNGCIAAASATSFTVNGSIAVNAGFTPDIYTGQAPLNVTFANSTTGATVYNWILGNGTSTQQTPGTIYNAPGTYTVILTATNGGCIDTAMAIIIVDAATTILIPNIYSPNGDGLNDEFMIQSTGMKTLRCDIYNRWGQLVYTLNGPNDKWDGTMNNGSEASEGTYYYILNAEGYDNKVYKAEGHLTLVK